MSFDRAWQEIGHYPPVAHRLKSLMSHRWVRFYSLPDGKRYADTGAESEEIRTRVDLLITETCSAQGDLLLVTGLHADRGQAPDLDSEQQAVHNDAEYWCAIDSADADADQTLHLWASWERYKSRSLDALIDRTAEEKLANTLIIEPKKRVVLHPYDGGIDVFMPTTSDRDAMRNLFEKWASPLPSGL